MNQLTQLLAVSLGVALGALAVKTNDDDVVPNTIPTQNSESSSLTASAMAQDEELFAMEAKVKKLEDELAKISRFETKSVVVESKGQLVTTREPTSYETEIAASKRAIGQWAAMRDDNIIWREEFAGILEGLSKEPPPPTVTIPPIILPRGSVSRPIPFLPKRTRPTARVP